MSENAACQEARDALATPVSDAFAAARVMQHRQHCAACRAYAAQIESVRGAIVAAAGPELSDITRARISARLAMAIDELATRNARLSANPAAIRLRPHVGAALLAVAACLLFLYLHPRPRPLKPPAVVAAPRPTAPVREAPAVNPPAREAAADERPLLRPYVVAGPAAHTPLGKDTSQLEVPSGALVRAALGRYARLTLLGPARLVVQEEAEATSVRLESGTLLGEYEHHGSGTLRIRSPGAITTVVGTIFVVQATAKNRSRVAVSRGTVLVQSDDASVRISAGWSWSSGEGLKEEIPESLAEQLTAHAAALPVPSAPVGVLLLQGLQEASESRLDGALLGPPPLTALVPTGVHLVSVATADRQRRTLRAVISHEQTTRLFYTPAEPPPKLSATPPAPPLTPVPPVTATLPPPLKNAAPADDKAGAVTADRLYSQAEAAMRSGDSAAVRATLHEVIRRFPSDALAGAALYELARLERTAGQQAQANAYLDEFLARGDDKALREPAQYLRCRLLLDGHREPQATDCLFAFRRNFPRSPHDAEVLALLIGLVQARSDCFRAVPLLDEYRKLYPSGALDARARLTQCGR
jgi:outer membrane protein assembly factor BamD (BamD/ComL family)